jgi:hypothetical protein
MADDVKQGTLDGFFKKLPPGQKAPPGMPTKRTPQLEAAIAARIEDQAEWARATARCIIKTLTLQSETVCNQVPTLQSGSVHSREAGL